MNELMVGRGRKISITCIMKQIIIIYFAYYYYLVIGSVLRRYNDSM